MTDPPPVLSSSSTSLSLLPPPFLFFSSSTFSSVSGHSRRSSFCLQAPTSSSPLTSVSPPRAFCLSSHPPCFFFCEQPNVYFMSASSSILTGRLLGGFAPLPRILFVPLFAVSIKDEIEISCASARKRARTQASLCTRRTRRLTKQRRAEAYERARTSRPTFLLCLLRIPSLHSLALCPRLHLLCLLLSCCSAAGDGCDPRFLLFLASDCRYGLRSPSSQNRFSHTFNTLLRKFCTFCFAASFSRESVQHLAEERPK